MKISTLRPGLLVSLHTSVRGNVTYTRVDLEREHLLENGMTSRARHETTKTTEDKEEHERAVRARTAARGEVVRVCTQTSNHGLLCRLERSDELRAAVERAQAIADEFNASATLTRVDVSVVVGEIAQDDVQAVRSINNEMRTLIDAMAQGIKDLDVDAVRKAAANARTVGKMLSDDANNRVAEAVRLARAAANDIKKAGETAAAEIDTVTLARLHEARTAFLDLDDTGTEIQMPTAAAPAVDFEPEAPAKPEPVPGPSAPAVDFDPLENGDKFIAGTVDTPQLDLI